MHRSHLSLEPIFRTITQAFGKRGVLQIILPRLLVIIGLMAVFPEPVFSESPAASAPENAHWKRYSDGWECDPSFRADGDMCIAVAVPQNAYPTNRTYGSGWECLHGFVEAGGVSCAEVVVPEGGYLDLSGRRWNCLRGFRKIDGSCQKIVLPEHSYLTGNTHGPAWRCTHGFEAKGETCVAIVIPEHAFLNTSTLGRRWTCERGYAASGDHCSRLDPPPNAHIDRTGNGWACNKNFQRKMDRCILNN